MGAFIILAFVAVFFVALLFLIPILYSLQAVGSLFIYPKQLKSMFGNKILRAPRSGARDHRGDDGAGAGPPL